MADSFNSPVFHVKNFSANNNLRFKYTMPSSSVKTRSRSGGSGISGNQSYSKALSIIPYTSSYDSKVSLRSPKSPSSSTISRHYTAPLPALSISTAAESLLLGSMKSTLISPGSARSLRYTRSSSASVVSGGGGTTMEVQRISSNSFALLAPDGPKSPSASGSTTGTSVLNSPLSPISMFPIMSKSLLRYRHHSFTRTPSVLSSRRCGSVDPEIYRRVSLSRQFSNYSTHSPSATTTLDRKTLPQSRSHSASCSNSRSGSIDRYTSGSSSSATTRQQHHSGPENVFLRESSFSLLGTSNNAKYQNGTRAGSINENDSSNGSATGSKSTSVARQSVTELARNVASHQWDSHSESTTTQRHETENEKEHCRANVNNMDALGKTIRNGSNNDSSYQEDSMPISNSHKSHDSETLRDDSGMNSSSASREFSRQSSVATTSDLESCSSSASTNTQVPAAKSVSILNGVNGHANHENGTRGSSGNGVINGYGNRLPPPPPPILAVAQSTTTSKRITTASGVTTSTTDIIDMKFVNGFVHLMGTNGTSSGSLDRISASTPSRSTRQKIRLAKLQNKYGVFKSWLTPEDEQTLARVSIKDNCSNPFHLIFKKLLYNSNCY